MRAAVCIKAKSIFVRDVAIPKISANEVLLRVRACGLCGSDIKKFMEGYAAGEVILGHEIVGLVEDVGHNVRKFKPGDRVAVAHHVPCFQCHYCLHENYSMCAVFKKSNIDPGGFAEFIRIPATHVEHSAFKIPDAVSDEEALLMEPLACCLRCLDRLKLLKNDTVLLVGFGSIGFLFLKLLQNQDCRVLVLDLDESRLKWAQSLGAKALHAKNADLQGAILEATAGRGADAVLFTAGSAALLPQAAAYLREGGSLCLFSELKGAIENSIVDTGMFYRRELTLTASYSPGPKDLAHAHEMISAGDLKLNDLEMNYFSLDEIPQAVAETLERKILKAVIRL